MLGVKEFIRLWSGTVVTLGAIAWLAVVAVRAEPMPDETESEIHRAVFENRLSGDRLDRTVRLASPNSLRTIPDQIAAEVRSMAAEVKFARSQGTSVATARLVVLLRYAAEPAVDGAFADLDYEGDGLLGLGSADAASEILDRARSLNFVSIHGVALAAKICDRVDGALVNGRFCAAARVAE